eukprot:14295081-Heterocapsa_arctica.AAC.1
MPLLHQAQRRHRVHHVRHPQFHKVRHPRGPLAGKLANVARLLTAWRPSLRAIWTTATLRTALCGRPEALGLQGLRGGA